MNLATGFSASEFRINVVITNAPPGTGGIATDAAERFEEFEQADVFVTETFLHGQRIGGDGSVDG